MRIKKGYYSMNDIKTVFSRIKEMNDYDDDFEIGEILEMRINENPPLDLIVEVIDIGDEGVLLGQILEVQGDSEEHSAGDIIFIPPDLFEWD
jgi:hypothetical protein